MTLVIFVEEPSMKEALEALLPKLGVNPPNVIVIPFQGVSNLIQSVPRKLRAWRDPTARFLILRDNDGGDCAKHKQSLIEICQTAGKSDVTKIRIVCQELEAWFLGDPAAIDAAGLGKRVATQANIRKWHNPDIITKPSRVLKQIFGYYPKVEGARKIGECINIESNKSSSFQHTMQAIRELAEK